jgi:hypothetical protein
MSDMTDCLYEEGSVSEDKVNNDNLNSMTGFSGFELSDDKHGQDNGLLEHVFSNIFLFPRIYS